MAFIGNASADKTMINMYINLKYNTALIKDVFGIEVIKASLFARRHKCLLEYFFKLPLLELLTKLWCFLLLSMPRTF